MERKSTTKTNIKHPKLSYGESTAHKGEKNPFVCKVQLHWITPWFLLLFPSSTWITDTLLWLAQTTVLSSCLTSALIRRWCATRTAKRTVLWHPWPCLCQADSYLLDMTTLIATSGTCWRARKLVSGKDRRAELKQAVLLALFRKVQSACGDLDCSST